MADQHLYPISQEEVKDLLNRTKAKQILDFLDICKKDLNHYTKLYKRYKVINNIVKYSSYSVLTISEVVGVVLAILGTSGILIPVVIGVSGFAETLIAVIISDGFLNRRSNHYKDLTNKIKIFIAKFYHFSNKALSDNIITDDELSECEILQKEYNNILNNHREVIHKDNKNVNQLIENQLKLITTQMQELKKLQVKGGTNSK